MTPNWSPWWCYKRCSIHLRGAVVALREQPAAWVVSLSANTIGLQQAGARSDRDAACVIAHLVACTSRAPTMCGWLTRLRSSAGARVRPRNAPIWPVGPSMGTARRTRASSGTAPAPGMRPVGAAGGVRADRRQGRRTRNSARDARRRPELARDASRSDVDGRQELLRQAIQATLAAARIKLLRPARAGEKPRAGQGFFKPLRQVIESVNNTLKTQLDLERHGGRTIAGVAARVLQRILALTAAISQRQNREADPAITDRIRPLTP